MSPIQIKTRSEFGFSGRPYGHVFLINGTPFLQLHKYEDYYTLFWLGRADISGLHICLKEAVEELSETLHIPRHHLDRASAIYGRNRGPVSMPYYIFNFPNTPLARKGVLKHENFIRQNLPILNFARFDVSSRVPIILWGDLKPSPQSEVGFSSIRIPAAVTKYFRYTCVLKISDGDFKEVKEQLSSLAPPLINLP
jgi:hypothetical protein